MLFAVFQLLYSLRRDPFRFGLGSYGRHLQRNPSAAYGVPTPQFNAEQTDFGHIDISVVSRVNLGLIRKSAA